MARRLRCPIVGSVAEGKKLGGTQGRGCYVKVKVKRLNVFGRMKPEAIILKSHDNG